jgi:aspartate/methionine/tyrosine aminotransferase
MPIKIAQRAAVPPFIVMDVLRRANEREAAGAEILHLEIGQPSTGAPGPVLEAAKRALDADRLGYTDALGIPALRERIAEFYRERYGAAIDPQRVAVTIGSSGAFLLGFLAAFEPGDRVALAAPGYPAYRNILTALGVVPVEIPVGPETRFQPTVDLLARLHPKPDGLIVASPSNPTGTMLSATELAALARWCEAQDVRLVSDEIYHGIIYGEPASTALAFSNTALIVNSFSKYFSMTGWRLGWMIVPEDLVRPLECLGQNLFIAPPSLSQHAAVAVFDCTEELDRHVARYAANRELLLSELPSAGFDRLAPADGAFYLYADIGHLTNDSPDFCARMLQEIGVATTPGVDFDVERGARSVRLSFAGATETIAAAARRLREWRR